jgi:hypothetical protein
MAVGGAVEHLVERARDMCKVFELVVGDADVEAIGEFVLELERRNQRHQVGVAATLANAVERTLDLARTGAHRRQRIRHRLLGVVVGMDADAIAGDHLHHLADDRLDLVRQRAAVGVAQDDPAGALVIGRFGAGERILGIGLVTVEEVLAIEQDLAALGLGGAHAVADRRKVLLQRRLERDTHVIVPRLGDEADGVGLGVEQRAEAGIVRRRAAGATRHPERRERRVELAMFGEQLRVGRIGARIAPLDIVHAEIVQQRDDDDLVVQSEVDAIRLRAVAQGGVEQIKPFACHGAHLTSSQACQNGAPRPPCSTSFFSIVVLANHSPASNTLLRCCAA